MPTCPLSLCRWNKDSSAIHVLPRVSVLTLPELGRLQRAVDAQLLSSPSGPAVLASSSSSGSDGLSLVLKLVNPVHGKVSVTLVPQDVAEAQEDALHAAAVQEAVRRACESGRQTDRGR